MESKNVTIKLPVDLLEAIRVLAASRDLSLSGLFGELARKTVAGDGGFRSRRKRFRERLRKGLPLGTHGRRTSSRDELHER